MVNGDAIAAPVGWLLRNPSSPSVRISHWHRAVGVAALLLVPLVSLIPRVLPSPVVLPAAAALLMLDRVYGPPVSWPLPTMQSPSMATLPVDQRSGPVLVQPARFPDIPPHRARFRDPALLAEIPSPRHLPGRSDGPRTQPKGALRNNALEHASPQRSRRPPGHRHSQDRATARLAVYTSPGRSNARRDARWAAYLGAR